MAGFAAIIGLAIAGSDESKVYALIFLIVFLITGAGNVINDYYDRNIDAVNRPNRPIPSGRLSPFIALIYSIILFSLGSFLAIFTNRLCFTIAILNSSLLILYARNLKATPLAGNICVAYLTGSTFLFGGSVVGVEGLIANRIPFLLSFLATMSREIMKDVEDMEGDRQGGAKTLPLLAGEKISEILAAFFVLVAVALSYFAPFGQIYIILVSVADIFFLLSAVTMARSDASGSQKALKIGMSIALLAFLSGALQQQVV